MNPALSFLLGFCAGGLLWLGLALLYYRRARKRVRAIEAAIKRYQSASKVVGQAADKAYGRKKA